MPQGAQGTGYNPPPVAGVLGFLSGIYHAVTNTLNVQLQPDRPSQANSASTKPRRGRRTGWQINAAIPAGTNTIGQTYGFGNRSPATITRPANTTTYTANTGFANATSWRDLFDIHQRLPRQRHASPSRRYPVPGRGKSDDQAIWNPVPIQRRAGDTDQ